MSWRVIPFENDVVPCVQGKLAGRVGGKGVLRNSLPCFYISISQITKPLCDQRSQGPDGLYRREWCDELNGGRAQPQASLMIIIGWSPQAIVLCRALLLNGTLSWLFRGLGARDGQQRRLMIIPAERAAIKQFGFRGSPRIVRCCDQIYLLWAKRLCECSSVSPASQSSRGEARSPYTAGKPSWWDAPRKQPERDTPSF